MTTRRFGSSGRTLLRLLALLAVFGLVAAACGGDQQQAEDVSPEEREEQAGAQDFPVDEGTPEEGGSLVYGIEADTQNPWTPASAICAIACHTVMKSFYDPLMIPDEEGIAQPNLLESMEPNEDFTVWTLTPRPDITFHDGTPFTAESIRVNLQDHLDSGLTQVIFKDIESVETSPDGASALVNMSTPWASFPIILTGTLGYMASDTWLAGVRAEPATEEATEPVGTGPFVFESYSAGENFTAVKNEEYWKQGPDGAQLPYLDEIEFRIFPEGEARVNAVLSGQSSLAHTSSGDQISRIRGEVEDGNLETVESDEFGEIGYNMLNVSSGNPRSNEALQDVDVRRALAMAIDRETIRDTIGAGVGQLGNGPFPPGTIGYLEDTGYPDHDPDEATRLIEEYEAENGPVEIDYSTTNDPILLRTTEAVVQDWNDVGIDASISQVEQGQFILLAVTGDFNVFTWRNHGGFDPDQQNQWWHSDSVEPQGALALNFGRFSDDVIDENLEIIRASGDADERRGAAEAINRRFGEQAYNLWGGWTIWSFPHAEAVNGIGTAFLPDGETPVAFPSQDKITMEVSSVWCEGGDCG